MSDDWSADLLVYLLLECYYWPDATVEEVYASQFNQEVYFPIIKIPEGREVPLEELRYFLDHARTFPFFFDGLWSVLDMMPTVRKETFIWTGYIREVEPVVQFLDKGSALLIYR